MRDTVQVRAMDDYFHALLLDEYLGQDDTSKPERIPEVQWQRQPETIVEPAPYLKIDDRLTQLSELLAQVGQVQFEIDALAHEEPLSEPLQIEVAESLLPWQPVRPEAVAESEEPAVTANLDAAVVFAPEPALAPALEPVTWQNIDSGKEFQVLFFEVAGVTFAVPLTDLGGIHQMGEVTTLFGQPAWYKGLMTFREQKMNVVDTAKWIMPGQRLEMNEYKYLIMLGQSSWGLSCHHLKGTELLHRDKVKWRHQAGKRPWLAGMVKEKMCALLHVSELLLLLARGVNIEGR